MPTKSKENIQENDKTVKKGLHRQMIMDGSEGKKLKNVVLLRILNTSKKYEKITESERMKEIAHLCLRLGRRKAVRRNGGISPTSLRKLQSKALIEVWDIAPMCQCELAHPCLRLVRSKALRENGGIDPMCLIPL